MVDLISFIHDFCPYILHKEFRWINELGFHFRQKFVYFKMNAVYHVRKERLMIDRLDFLNDSIEKNILRANNLMFGVDICYLHEWEFVASCSINLFNNFTQLGVFLFSLH